MGPYSNHFYSHFSCDNECSFHLTLWESFRVACYYHRLIAEHIVGYFHHQGAVDPARVTDDDAPHLS